MFGKVSAAVRLVLMTFLVVPSAFPAAAKGTIDLVLVRDLSGSMRKTDPKTYSADALQLLLNLLGPEDRVALLTFDRNARRLSDFRSLAPTGKIFLKTLVTKERRPTGAYTQSSCGLGRGLGGTRWAPPRCTSHGGVIHRWPDGRRE